MSLVDFKKIILLFLLFLGFQSRAVFAWTNPGFETGDFTGWTVTTGSGVLVSVLPFATVVVPSVAPNTNGTICVAPSICLNQVENGSYSAMINSGYGDNFHGDWARISQTDTISAGSPFLSFWFAAVLSGDHYMTGAAYGSDAYVAVDVLVSGVPIYSQRFSWYDNLPLLVDDGSPAALGPWKHLPWTQYYYDMSAYVGQNATINYTAYNCSPSGHYCIGYIDNAQWMTAATVGTYTPLPTDTPGPTNTFTPTITNTKTPTPTPTVTNTPTFTDSPTVTDTPTTTNTATNTATVTCTYTPTTTFTPTPSFTPTCVTYVWPNPYNPKTAVGGTLRISCMTPQTKVQIFTISGELVQIVDNSTSVNPCSVNTASVWGTSYCWNGRNKMGMPVATGIYLYVVEEGGKVTQRGKFLIVNGS